MQKKPRAISIIAYMDKTYDIRKIGGDKIALLGLFVVSLIIARIIVVSKSAILLSEPIRLTRSGLSVSMPEGNGWKSEQAWRSYENGFSLRSSFTLGTRNPTAKAQCSYIGATGTTDLQRLFAQKVFDVEEAFGVEVEIVDTGQIYEDTLTFDWALIENRKISLIIIFGTAKLSHNRRLDIEVQQVMGNHAMNVSEMAELVFKQIIANLNFEENQLLVSGTADDIIIKFPEWADYTPQTNKSL